MNAQMPNCDVLTGRVVILECLYSFSLSDKLFEASELLKKYANSDLPLTDNEI